MKKLLIILILFFSKNLFADLISCEMFLKEVDLSYAVAHNETIKMDGKFQHDEFKFEVLYEYLNSKWHLKEFNWSYDIFYPQQKKQHDVLKTAYSKGKLTINKLSRAFGLKLSLKGSGKKIKNGLASINKATKKDREEIYNQNKGILFSYNDALLGLKKIWREDNLGSDTYLINFNKNTPKSMSINKYTHDIISNIDARTDLFKADLKIKGVVTDFYYDLKFKGDCRKADTIANNSEKSKISPSQIKQEQKKSSIKKADKKTKKIISNKTSNSLDEKGYADCILENMKDVSSDEAAVAIKEACTYKYLSQNTNSNVVSSSNNNSTYSNNTIGIVSLPSNLSSCGSITTTRFPIFTGC